jgi:hypothetical protein
VKYGTVKPVSSHKELGAPSPCAQEKAKLLKIVLSNCAVDAASVYHTYRKPFDSIFQAAETERWWGWGESNSRHAV